MLNSNLGHNISFKQADVNILALSDTHGDTKSTIPLYQNIKDSKDDVFIKKSAPSTLNLLAVVGDWFMNPTQKGFLTYPKMTTGQYQSVFLNAIIKKTKSFVPDLKVLYTPGNHCLDGGSKVLLENTKNIDMDTIISNSHIENAPDIKNLDKSSKNKISESKILEIPDDKDPKKIHKVLALGIIPINIDYLVKEDISGLGLFGTKNIKDADLKEKDARETCVALKEIVDKFKEKNPDGAVMLMSHAGEPVSKTIARNVQNIDLILNAHDHQDKLSYVKNDDGKITRIVSLSQNAQKIEGVNIHFDDDNNITVSSKPHYTDFKNIDPKNPIQALYNYLFKKDLSPIFSIKDPLGRSELSIDNVRYENNDLANFCTDAVYSEIKKEHPEVTVFGVGSTAFRKNLPTSTNRPIINMDNIDLMKGIAGELANVMVGSISGQILASYIYENVIDNLSSPSRNALNQFSGIVINKAAIQDLSQNNININSKNPKCAYQYIQIRNEFGEFEPIDPEKNYNVALPKKLFVKSTNKPFHDSIKNFENTNIPVDAYFRQFAENCAKEIDLNLDYRIIT
ncbi:MAG: metallophosphoesterase [Candidatus Gastranaerophilales bacterium]|nr:metallophosphoesterase [Candidatus Gastranaerophilales bacterium]